MDGTAGDSYATVEWAASLRVFADPDCSRCFGDGVDDREKTCRCLVRAVIASFPEVAEDAVPVPTCRGCGGDGIGWSGDPCPCLLVDLQRLLQPSRDLDGSTEAR